MEGPLRFARGHERMDLPSGLDTSSINLGDLLNQTPGRECDFGQCLPTVNSLVGADDAAEIGLCVVNPIACGIIFTGAVIAYEIWIHRTQSIPSAPSIDEDCALWRSSTTPGLGTKCYYDCPKLGELCKKYSTTTLCPLHSPSWDLGPCD